MFAWCLYLQFLTVIIPYLVPSKSNNKANYFVLLYAEDIFGLISKDVYNIMRIYMNIDWEFIKMIDTG